MPGEAGHLPFGEVVLRVAREARVVDRRDLRVVLQEPRHGEGVLLVLAHADGEGLEAPEHDPGVERPRHAAGGVLVEGHPLVQVGIRGDRRPADDVGVAAHVLRRRVDHDVRAKESGCWK
jgi:hypothetical protein